MPENDATSRFRRRSASALAAHHQTSLVTVRRGGGRVLVLLPLGAIFGYLIYRGIGSINWAFLTQTPKPVGEPGGGMANAIVGSVVHSC